jgi:hypothetical protein
MGTTRDGWVSHLRWEGAVDVFAVRISVGPAPLEAAAEHDINTEA